MESIILDIEHNIAIRLKDVTEPLNALNFIDITELRGRTHLVKMKGMR